MWVWVFAEVDELLLQLTEGMKQHLETPPVLPGRQIFLKYYIRARACAWRPVPECVKWRVGGFKGRKVKELNQENRCCVKGAAFSYNHKRTIPEGSGEGRSGGGGGGVGGREGLSELLAPGSGDPCGDPPPDVAVATAVRNEVSVVATNTTWRRGQRQHKPFPWRRPTEKGSAFTQSVCVCVSRLHAVWALSSVAFREARSFRLCRPLVAVALNCS